MPGTPVALTVRVHDQEERTCCVFGQSNQGILLKLSSNYIIKFRTQYEKIFLNYLYKYTLVFLFQDFSDRYHQTKREQASSIETLTNLVTGKDLQRSNSIVEELETDTQ